MNVSEEIISLTTRVGAVEANASDAEARLTLLESRCQGLSSTHASALITQQAQESQLDSVESISIRVSTIKYPTPTAVRYEYRDVVAHLNNTMEFSTIPSITIVQVVVSWRYYPTIFRPNFRLATETFHITFPTSTIGYCALWSGSCTIPAQQRIYITAELDSGAPSLRNVVTSIWWT